MAVCSSAPNLTCYFPPHHVFRPPWIVVYALPPSTFELRSWIHRYRGQTPLSLPSCANGFCTTCSTALPSTPLLTCQHYLRGCCVLLYGSGFPGLVFGLCFWFFISIFVVFRQNGFQSAMRWVVSSPLATFSGLPELESPHPLPMLRGKVSCSYFSEFKHDGTTPQLPTELQQVTTPPRGWTACAQR